jgi:drug/metabolite transporter (DMT)-like permease
MQRNQNHLLAIAGLISNALIWGLIWWPLKELRLHGWHPLWATTAIFLIATAGVLMFKPRALSQLLASPSLWTIAVAAGITNGAFSWAMAIGDVVRVILLFYLMPIWTVLLARILLHEKITLLSLVRTALALIGAGLVLKPESGGLSLPSGLADWLGLVAGAAFALNNVMIRRSADQPREGRTLAMFVGGLLLPAAVAAGIGITSANQLPSLSDGYALSLVAGLGVVIFIANNALQYGASRLPANVTAVVMLTEVVFAALSSVLILGTVLTGWMLGGGALIVIASMLAAFEGKAARASVMKQPGNARPPAEM